MVYSTNKYYIGLQQAKLGTAIRQNLPAPTGGLNTRDSESNMDVLDAVVLENWFPSQGYVTTRKGYTEHVTGLTGAIESLMEYISGTTRKHLCANNGEINDISDPLSVSNLATGFVSSRWQTVNFNDYLLLFNGVDTPQLYDGSTITASTINGTGLVAANLTGVNVHKNRVYAWDTDSADFWYGSLNAVQGTFTKFPLSRVSRRGGNIVSMQTWNLDGGDGVDDYALFLMSTGEAILYAGSDPGDSSDWSLVGTYTIGVPLSVRSAKKIGSDVVIITDQDFIFFSQVFRNGGLATAGSKLSGAALEAASVYSSNYGWEVASYPSAGWLIFNVPIATGVKYIQYVINTISGAATKFTNMNANTWGTYNNNLFFGGDGVVYRANNGFNDNGNFIECKGQQAYSNLGSPFAKTMSSYRITVQTDGNVTLNSSINFDYGSTLTTQTVSSESVGSPWDTSPWDTSPWSPENQTRSLNVLGTGDGVDISLGMNTSLKGQEVKWFRTDISYMLNNTI